MWTGQVRASLGRSVYCAAPIQAATGAAQSAARLRLHSEIGVAKEKGSGGGDSDLMNVAGFNGSGALLSVPLTCRCTPAEEWDAGRGATVAAARAADSTAAASWATSSDRSASFGATRLKSSASTRRSWLTGMSFRCRPRCTTMPGTSRPSPPSAAAAAVPAAAGAPPAGSCEVCRRGRC